jgi:hypothetical protein
MTKLTAELITPELFYSQRQQFQSQLLEYAKEWNTFSQHMSQRTVMHLFAAEWTLCRGKWKLHDWQIQHCPNFNDPPFRNLLLGMYNDEANKWRQFKLLFAKVVAFAKAFGLATNEDPLVAQAYELTQEIEALNAPPALVEHDNDDHIELL